MTPAKPNVLLSDLDGVWTVAGKPVPGAVETLERIRARKLPLRFITNTTTKTRAQIAQRLADAGLAVAAEEIITAPRAAALYLEQAGIRSIHLVASDDISGEFAAFERSRDPEAVVIGDIGSGWNYDVMNACFKLVVQGARLVAMHKGRYWQVEDGLTLDIGAFVAGLEYAAGKEAVIAGKPSPTVFTSALSELGVTAQSAIMVGDDIHSDVGGAQGAGVRAALVRTGKFREELVRESGVEPDWVIDSIADIDALL